MESNASAIWLRSDPDKPRHDDICPSSTWPSHLGGAHNRVAVDTKTIGANDFKLGRH